ncbi:unnamed protein product, partial [marine sediment metagenome]
CYSSNWTFGKWWFMGLSRIGASAQFYRGDIDSFTGVLATTIRAGGLVDPEGCSSRFSIGCNTLTENFLKGLFWRLRAWFDRALIEAEWQQVWEKEVEWFRS